MTVSESGWAEYTGRGRWDDPDLEIGDVQESERSLLDWRSPDGGRPGLAPLPFTEDEVSPPEALAAANDAEPEFSEATGNEGASFERFYQCATLVLWPRRRRAEVLCGGGLGVSIPALLDLTQRWESAGTVRGGDLWTQAIELSDAIVRGWPESAWARKHASDSGQSSDLLVALDRLDELDICARFIAEQVAAGAYGPADNPGLSRVLGRLPREQSAGLLTRVVSGNAPRLPGACAGLLLRRTEAADIVAESLRPATQALLDALVNDARPQPGAGGLDARREDLSPEQIADLVIGLARIDPAIADRAVDHLLSWAGPSERDQGLLPAALIIRARWEQPETEAVARLRLGILAHLDARIALPLEPPRDWARDAVLPCDCALCRDLAQFLANPDRPGCQLKAAEPSRRHVEDTISRARCDLDLRTDKRGRP